MRFDVLFRRFGAYLIDFLIVMFISSALLHINFINPRYDKYMETYDEYNEVLEDYYEEKIDIDEYSENLSKLSYELNKNGYVYTIGEIIITFLYFGVFPHFTGGQTLGKKIFKLKIVNIKDKAVKLYNYFIRVFILNGIMFKLLILIAIFFRESIYYKIYNVASIIDGTLNMIIVLMILFSAEGRGLHDVLARTKVIDLKLQALNKEEENLS